MPSGYPEILLILLGAALAALLVRAIYCRRMSGAAGVEAQRLQAILDAIPAPIFFKDAAGVYLGCNQSFCTYLGLPREKIIGQTVYGVAPPELAKVYHQADLDLMAAGGIQVYEAKVRYADGSLHDVMFHKAVLRGGGLVGAMLDITSRKQLEEELTIRENALRDSEDRYRAFVANSTEGIFRADLNPPLPVDQPLVEQIDAIIQRVAITECNETYARLYGYTEPGEMVGLQNLQFYDTDSIRELVTHFIENGYRVSDRETRQFDRNGREIWLATSLVGTVEEGFLTRVWGTRRDVTERKRQVEALEHMANYDSLTRLPNRYWLRRRLKTLLAVGDTLSQPMALLLIDLDRFKEVNDSLGHHSGDQLLKLLAERLGSKLRLQGCELVRLGGDEFAVLVTSVGAAGSIGAGLTAQRVAGLILQTLKLPFELAGLQVEIGASIGISLYPDHGDDPSTLLRCADVALYRAKNDVRRVCTYEASSDPHSPARLALVSELGGAIRDGQLVLHYQPKIDLQSQKVTGVEALVRWQHPQRGLIPPGEFVPIAEMGALIVPLTGLVIDQALQQWRRWADAGLELTMAVNISPRLLMDWDFPSMLAERMRACDVPPGALELELTETAFFQDPKHAADLLEEINLMGVGLSIDDFGTGYSSLSLLRRLPLQTLKIDRMFVAEIAGGGTDLTLVESTINLAHNLGLKVVAEGVEDAAALTTLQQLGCDEGQGYFFARPMPVDDFEEWLTKAPGWM